MWWSGCYHDLGPAGSPEARAKYGRLVALWASDPTATERAGDDYLVADLLADWRQSDAVPTDPRLRSRAKTASELLLEHHLITPAAEFGPNDLLAWQKWLCGLTRDGCSAPRFNVTTVSDIVGVVKRVWKWGAGTDRVPAERWQALLAVERPRVGDGPGEARPGRAVEPADPAHVRATVPFLRPPVRAMVLLQWHTGARPAELCGLTPGAVRRSGQVHVPGVGVVDLDALGVWAVVLARHKTAWKGKPRWLQFAGDAQRVLAPYLDRPAGTYCFSPREAVESLRAEQRAARLARGGGSGGSRKPPAASPGRPAGARYSPKAYYTAVRRACVRAGVPHWYPYQLRHLTAAEVKAAFGVDAVAATLGHHTRTMAEHYGGGASRWPPRWPGGGAAGRGDVPGPVWSGGSDPEPHQRARP